MTRFFTVANFIPKWTQSNRSAVSACSSAAWIHQLVSVKLAPTELARWLRSWMSARFACPCTVAMR